MDLGDSEWLERRQRNCGEQQRKFEPRRPRVSSGFFPCAAKDMRPSRNRSARSPAWFHIAGLMMRPSPVGATQSLTAMFGAAGHWPRLRPLGRPMKRSKQKLPNERKPKRGGNYSRQLSDLS